MSGRPASESRAGAGVRQDRPTAQKLSYHLRELDSQMAQYDKIEHRFQSNGTGGKKHFFQSAITEEWVEVQELILPF